VYHFDRRRDRAWLSARSDSELRRRQRWLGEIGTAPPPPSAGAAPAPPRPAMTREAYVRMVERALAYIAAGDIYQANLAQRFIGPPHPRGGRALFAALRDCFPMPFSAYVGWGEREIVSNSPECFLVTRGRDVATYPIKGTLRRGDGSRQNREAAALAADPKERAEHIMIVDLERNDLGRVCEPGSVRVDECARVRSYPLLHHMVSTVRGRLREEMTLPALLAATFPGGSITGAPKIRAMQIIEELEPCVRGLYTGAIGWTEPGGDSRFNLAIRTAFLTKRESAYFAGG